MSSNQRPFTATEIIKDEGAAIEAGRARRHSLKLIGDDDLSSRHRAGLAISGGGIRSATFALGGLQTLARRGLLARMDYLSTVSGGGYIGSWLTAWILREGFDVVNRDLTTDTSILPPNTADPHFLEPRPIHYLRKYTSYLTPKVGLVSGDTWAAVAIYLRNLLLNQAILIGCLMLLLMLPRLLAKWLTTVVSNGCVTSVEWIVFCIAWLLASCFAGLGLNAFHHTGHGPHFSRERKFFLKPAWFVAPVVVSAFAAAFAISAEKNHPSDLVKLYSSHVPNSYAVNPVAIAVVAGVAGVLILTGLTALFAEIGEKSVRGQQKTVDVEPVRRSVWRWILAAAATGACVAGMLYLYWTLGPTIAPPGTVAAAPMAKTQASATTKAPSTPNAVVPAPATVTASSNPTAKGRKSTALTTAKKTSTAATAKPADPSQPAATKTISAAATAKPPLQATPASTLWVTTFGPPLMILVFVLAGWLQLGVMGTAFPDAKREWLARAAGITLVVAAGWALFSAIALYSPVLFGRFITKLHGASLSWLVPPAWITTVVSGLKAAQSSKTGGVHSNRGLEALAKIAPPVFLLGLGMALAWIMQYMISGSPASINDLAQVVWVWDAPTIRLVVAAAIASSLILFVDVNEFSMHLFYRNRLVRAYLGASNIRRNPHPFTGFAADDDIRLSDLDPASPAKDDLEPYAGPYPLVCTALNLVAGDDLAWQQRKATSFVYSPRFCGYDHLQKNTSPGLYEQGYRRTVQFSDPEGPHLGTAMAASGAAASPNMGYHSSPAVAALMTFFDIRLGWWVGNPRDPKTWQSYGPAPYYLLNELFSKTDDESHYLYLSDGGHFENLAVYELVRRRLKLIIAFDGDADGDYKFGDLGGLIEKCRRDLGADIDISVKGISPAGDPRFSPTHFAIGRISYRELTPNLPEDHGWLIYIKSSLCGNEPEDVLAYQRSRQVFPHDPTADQFFTESQFESYRALGKHAVECSLTQLFGDEAISTKEIVAVLEQVYSQKLRLC